MPSISKPARSSGSPCKMLTTATRRRGVETLIEAAEQLETVRPEGEGLEEIVGDKGYHSNQLLVDFEAVGVRSYISEPDRGLRNWTKNPHARDAVYPIVAVFAVLAACACCGFARAPRTAFRPSL